MEWREGLRRAWRFIWYDDSLLSWFVNVLIAIVLIKFVVYPGLGLLLGTSYPIVAVVSSSMEHDVGFDAWWEEHQDFYLAQNITRQQFERFPLRNGFDRGDIMLLVGTPPGGVEVGDVIVFQAAKPYPIIHRVIKLIPGDNKVYFRTKGDNNPAIIQTYDLNEWKIDPIYYQGRAVLRIPWLGYLKIGFVELLGLVGLA